MLSGLERLLWRARLFVLAAVVASLAMTLALLVVALVDSWVLLEESWRYLRAEGEAAEAARGAVVAHAVRAIDGFLLATVTFLFGIGLYDLFVRRIAAIRRDGGHSRILEIRDLDQLKSKLGKVLVLILVVKLFEQTLALKISAALDVLVIGAGVLLMAIALYVSHAEGKRSLTRHTEEGE